MRSLRNSLVMVVDECFVSRMVFPHRCQVAEAVLAGRPIARQRSTDASAPPSVNHTFCSSSSVMNPPGN